MGDALQDLVAATLGAVAESFPGPEITYRLFVAAAFVPSAGSQVVSYHDVVIRGVSKDGVDVEDLAAGTPGLVQVGDLRYVFRAGLLADHLRYAKSGGMSTTDLIVDDGVAHNVIAFSTEGNGTMLVVIARRKK